MCSSFVNYWKKWPSANKTTFYYLNTGLVHYSDPNSFEQIITVEVTDWQHLKVQMKKYTFLLNYLFACYKVRKCVCKMTQFFISAKKQNIYCYFLLAKIEHGQISVKNQMLEHFWKKKHKIKQAWRKIFTGTYKSALIAALVFYCGRSNRGVPQ